jgi:hypothetical protein
VRVVSVHAKSYDSSCDMGYDVLTPPLPPARVARVVGPAVLSVSKFARKALATSKEGAQVHWLGGRLCFGGGFGGGGSLRAPAQRSERSTRLTQVQRLLTAYKRLVPSANTATPLLVFHSAHMRGLGASGAVMVRLEQPLAPPWRRSSIRPRDLAVECP